MLAALPISVKLLYTLLYIIVHINVGYACCLGYCFVGHIAAFSPLRISTVVYFVEDLDTNILK